MRTFTLQQSRTEVYTPHGGLALVGHCLNRHTSLIKTARTVVKRHGIPNIELIRTYLGLITLGKSDFEAAEPPCQHPGGYNVVLLPGQFGEDAAEAARTAAATAVEKAQAGAKHAERTSSTFKSPTFSNKNAHFEYSYHIVWYQVLYGMVV